MRNNKKKMLIGLILNIILFFNLIILIISPQVSPKFNLIAVKNQKSIAENLNFNKVNSNIYETLNFTLDNLWSEAYKAFYYYQHADGSHDENTTRIFTSFNVWSYFAMLEISQVTNNSEYFYNYSIPSLEYILSNLVNKSTYGVYHWCYENGSFPLTVYINDYNWSTRIYSTYQAWTILSLLNAYNLTGNITYLDDYAKPMLDFMITTLWDTQYNGFYREYFFNGNFDSEKESWYQQWPIIALLESYKVTNNITYMEYANKTLNFLLNYLWDNSYGGFYFYCQKNGTTPETSKHIRSQAGGLSALIKAVDILKNYTLIHDYIDPTLEFTINHLWNTNFGQFITNTSESGVGQDLIIRASEISFLLTSLLEIPKSYNLSSYSNYILKSLSHIINNMKNGTYFCKEFNLISGITNFDRWTIEQMLPLILLCKVYNNYQFYTYFTTFFIWQKGLQEGEEVR
ncbi:MAG: AGE family epimerase/isomerase, partial [Promethearchaeota archaeon]